MLILVGFGTDQSGPIIPDLVLAWVLIVGLTWVDGFESGLLGAILLCILFVFGPRPDTAWRRGAFLGVFVGCVHGAHPWLARALFVLSVIGALGISEYLAAGTIGLAFFVALVLSTKLSDFEDFLFSAARRLNKDLTAVSAYLLLFVSFAGILGLVHRAIDIHGSSPQLDFHQWEGPDPAPFDYYFYFAVVTSLAGPPSDVDIVGRGARFMVVGEVIVGLVIFALILKQLLSLSSVLIQGASPPDRSKDGVPE